MKVFYICIHDQTWPTFPDSCGFLLADGHIPSLRVVLDLLLHLPQPHDNLSPHEIRQTQYPLPRDNPIAPTVLPTPFDNLATPIDLHAPNDILRPRYPPKIRGIPQITDVNPTAHVASPSTALMARATCAVVWARQIEASRTGESGGLALHHGIGGGVLGHDGGEERNELRVRGEILGRRGQRGCGSYGELGSRRCCGEEREERFVRIDWVSVDELRVCSV